MTLAIQHGTLEANGVRLHYTRTGEGPTIVLLHGWPELWLTWEPVMARLADRFDLIAPDLRGFGGSPKPDEGPSDRAGAEIGACLDRLDRPEPCSIDCITRTDNAHASVRLPAMSSASSGRSDQSSARSAPCRRAGRVARAEISLSSAVVKAVPRDAS